MNGLGPSFTFRCLLARGTASFCGPGKSARRPAAASAPLCLWTSSSSFPSKPSPSNFPARLVRPAGLIPASPSLSHIMISPHRSSLSLFTLPRQYRAGPPGAGPLMPPFWKSWHIRVRPRLPFPIPRSLHSASEESSHKPSSTGRNHHAEQTPPNPRNGEKAAHTALSPHSLSSEAAAAIGSVTQSWRVARAQLLDNVGGFWPRLRLRIRLFLMGSNRPWRADDIFALFSWIFMGHTVFLLVGTTTFLSLLLGVANSLQFQGSIPESACNRVEYSDH